MYLPGKMKDYLFEQKGSVHYIKVSRIKAYDMISTIDLEIKQKQTQKNLLEKNMKIDGLESVDTQRVQQLSRSLCDFNQVLEVIKKGGSSFNLLELKSHEGAETRAEGFSLPKPVDPWESLHHEKFFNLNLKNGEHKSILHKISSLDTKLEVPKMKKLTISGICSDDIEILNIFLKSHFPRKVVHLHLSASELWDCDKIVHCLEKLSENIVSRLSFSRFEISPNSMTKIFNSFHHIKKLQFQCWTLHTKDLKFDPKIEFYISEIVIKSCGIEGRSDWAKDSDKLKGFIAAVKSWTLEYSLEIFWTKDNGLSFEEIEKHFVDQDLEDIFVTNQFEQETGWE